MRPRHRFQTSGARHRRTGRAGPHGAHQPGGLLGLRLLLLRHRQRASGPRACAGRGHGGQTQLSGKHCRRLPGRWRPGGHRHGGDHPRRQSRRGHHRDFVNNGIYGMTGGQMAPTTPLGRKTTTSPLGRDALNDGFPLHVCEMLNSLQAPVYIERVSLGNSKQIMHAAKVVKHAVENQVKGLGFSFVEVLSPCPTIWKMQPVEAKRFVQDEMGAVFPVCNLRDRTKEAQARPAAAAAPSLEDLPRLLDLVTPSGEEAAAAHPPRGVHLRIKVAGFGGQGVLMLGEVLAEAGLDAGYEVSWLPSYGPEMRSGTSNCHVRIGSAPIDSPIVSRPNVLLAINEPSLRKFLPTVEPGGIVLYNAPELPDDCERPGIRILAMHFTRLADELGATKAANIVMLGALLEAASLLDEEHVVGALRGKVKSQRWFDIDMAALQLGRKEVRARAAA